MFAFLKAKLQTKCNQHDKSAKKTGFRGAVYEMRCGIWLFLPYLPIEKSSSNLFFNRPHLAGFIQEKGLKTARFC